MKFNHTKNTKMRVLKAAHDPLHVSSVSLFKYLSEDKNVCGKRIIELGSGTGSTAIALAKFRGKNINQK